MATDLSSLAGPFNTQSIAMPSTSGIALEVTTPKWCNTVVIQYYTSTGETTGGSIASSGIDGNDLIPFRQFMTDDGTSSGDEDMRVDGSTTPVDFYISAITGSDIYIKTLAVLIADAGATLNQFGNIGSLSNGVKFFWESQKNGTITISEALQSNFDFVRLASGNPPFGSGNAAFRATNVIGASEAFIPVLDFEETFGFPYGIPLAANSNDRLVMRVQDNVSAVDAFNIIGYGTQLLRET